MDPNIIPYGWGLFSEDEEVVMTEKENVNQAASPFPNTLGLIVNPAELAEMIEVDLRNERYAVSLTKKFTIILIL